MHAIFRGLTVLWLAALGAGAAAAPTTRAVSEREAQSFGERVAQQIQHGDRRAATAYGSDSELTVLMVEGEQPSGLHLRGGSLRRFLQHKLTVRAPVKTGTSCRYDARSDGRVLESCISVNVLHPGQPSYSVSLIARHAGGLYYHSTFVTDSARLARRLGDYGPAEDEDEDEDEDDEAEDSLDA